MKGMYRGRQFRRSEDRMVQTYGPVHERHTEKKQANYQTPVVLPGLHFYTLRRSLTSDILEELLTHCTPDAETIEFNVYGITTDGKAIIAEATTTFLIDQSSGELTGMGWFKFFQLERQVASVGTNDICQAVLFSMDRAHVDVFRLFSKNLLRSFPCLHELWQTDRLNHLTWTEQHVMKTRPPVQPSK